MNNKHQLKKTVIPAKAGIHKKNKPKKTDFYLHWNEKNIK